jgi:hypothetical protein
MADRSILIHPFRKLLKSGYFTSVADLNMTYPDLRLYPIAR